MKKHLLTTALVCLYSLSGVTAFGDPTPETPVIPNNFSVTPPAGSEVESISSIVVKSMLYEEMKLNDGKTLTIDGKSMAVTAKTLDNWGSEFELTLVNPVVTPGVHSIVIPEGTFSYSEMFGGKKSNSEFSYTLVIPGEAGPEIITQQPAGELKTYDRGGSYYYNYEGYLRTGAQTGTIDIVFADDNKVYLKDPINNIRLGSWVVGTLNEDGTAFTVKMGQYLYEDPEYGYVILKMVEYDDDYEWFEPINTEEVTYKIEGESIKLQGTGRKGKCLGVVWETANEWAGNADYESVYTPVVGIDPVEVPDDLEIETYILKGLGYGGTQLEYTVNVGFDNDDMYIQGIFTDTPQAWVKGVQADGKVTFHSPQYLGKASYGNRSDLFMVATALEDTYKIVDLVLDYDEATGAYTNDSQYLVLNTSKNTIYMVEAISEFSITKFSSNNEFTVPYYEGFGSNASLNYYTIIDANNDGNGWYYTTRNDNGCMGYDYASTTADDWLITPAIILEGGCNYVFSVEARSFASMYPEKFEVKVGKAATAEAMTTTVIEATTVASDTFAPFTGKFTVPAEGGSYFFGIHAISDPDEFTLYIDNISVKEGETAGVCGIGEDINTDGTAYTLDGKVIPANNAQHLAPGFYVRNGKKIVVK